MNPADFLQIRNAIARIPADISNDAVGTHVAKVEDLYTPARHAAALDPNTPIVVGSRGSGKSFWSSVLGQADTRKVAARAYPNLGLEQTMVQFGYTGIGGLDGIDRDAIDAVVPKDAEFEQAKAFWWSTILSAAARASGDGGGKPRAFIDMANDWEMREARLTAHERRLRAEGRTLLIVYDALDTVARTWPRRRLLTEALLEVVWAMRAYQAIRLKLFLRPDQIEDDALRFVELPKLRTGAVRLEWSGIDLYGLLFARLAMTAIPEASKSFDRLVEKHGVSRGRREEILTRRWSLVTESDEQKRIMTSLAGQFMGKGTYAFKKGSTYIWPIKHLADAFGEVTPRSFLGMMIAAAQYGATPTDRALSPEGIRHGLRAASKTRVDQLQQEFPWIKGVLAPMAGLLLPQKDEVIYRVWQTNRTIEQLIDDAEQHSYLPPFQQQVIPMGGRELFLALERIGVMFRRKDDRLDMPDLFRVAAKLLKKGALAPA